MNLVKIVVPSAVALSVGFGLVSLLGQAVAADPDASIPPVVQAGFQLYASGGPEPAFDKWRQGGLLEGDRNVGLPRFRALVSPIGNYRSYELIETKGIGKTSKLVYLSVNFERGAVYASFLVYRTDRGWVIQNMDFNTKPEAIMPWLALGGGN